MTMRTDLSVISPFGYRIVHILASLRKFRRATIKRYDPPKEYAERYRDIDGPSGPR